MLRTRSDRGTALIAVLMISIVIAGLSATYIMRSVQSSRATRYNLDGERALSIAEGGLDHSMNQLAAQASGNVSGQLGGGAYSVTVTSPFPGVYTLVSTATYDGVARSVEATVQMIDTDPLSPPGALTIIDDGDTSIFSARFCGNAFIITGHDTNINGSAGSQPTVAGIGVFDNASVTAVLAALHANGVQDDNILGTGANPSVINVAPGSSLTFDSVESFADQMLLLAKVIVPAGGSNASFGTNASPQVTYFKGDCGIGGTTSGAGVLLVDGTLSVTGKFNFNGLIVLTGKSGNSFDLSSRGNTNVHGSIIVLNPESSLNTVNAFTTMDFRGNINIYYSSDGLSKAWTAVNGAGKPAVISWRRIR
jgi:hypothetical protein